MVCPVKQILKVKLFLGALFCFFVFAPSVVLGASAPTAGSVSISARADVGQTLTGSYVYADEDSDSEGVTTFRWLRAATSGGTYRAIAGATSATYTLTTSDLNQFIKFEVTPVATVAPETGIATLSSALGPVYLLSDDFTGTTIDTSTRWTERDSTGTNVTQSGSLTAVGNNTRGTNGIFSQSTFDRATNNLIIETDITYSNCASGQGGIYYDNGTNLPAGSQFFFRLAGVGNLYIYNTYNIGLSAAYWTCANGVPVHVKLVYLAAGGMEVYLNNQLSPGATVSAAQAPNTWNNKNLNFQQLESTSNINFDNITITDARAVPGAPTSLVASQGYTLETLNWTAPASVGSSAITDYIIEYKTTAGSSWSIFDDGTSVGTSAVVTGLTNAVEYDFRVSAVNSFGTGDNSSTSTGAPGGSGAPTAPTIISVTISGRADVGQTLTGSYAFVDVNGDSQGATTFRWLRAATSGGTYRAITGATSSVYVLTSSDINQYIKFEVTPVATVAPETGTAVLSSATGPIYLLSDDFTGTVINTSKWIEYDTGATNVAQNGNITVTGTQYLTHMTRGISSSSTFDRTLADLIIEADIAFTDCTHRGGIYYSAWGGLPADSVVLMRNTGGWILLKGSLTTSTVVTGATCTNNVATHVKLVIKAAGGAEAYLDNAVTPGGTLTAEQVPNTINNKNVNFSGTYDTGAVIADNFLIYNSFSAPGAPTAFSATGQNGQVALSWTAPASVGSSAITDYLIEYKTSAASLWTTFVHDASVSTVATITGLANDTAYDFRVGATNSDKTGDAATASSTPAATVTNQPTALAATVGDAQVGLTWTAPSDIGGSAITDYTIEYKTGAAEYAGFVHDASVLTSTTVTGLTNGLTYTFRVSAVNGQGTSAPSETTTGTPISATPTVPQASSVTVSGEQMVGSTLTGSYVYSDVNGNAEGSSIFQWQRADSSGGTYKDIQGATSSTYVLTNADINKYIKFKVTPASLVAPTPGTAQLSSAVGAVGLLYDDFTGTVINTSKWIEYDTGATNVAQNGNITVTGTQYLTHMTRGISSSSTFDRTLADLIIEADVTFTDCGHRGGIYYSAWGGLPADSIVLMRNSGGWILLKGSLTTSTGVTGATCTNNVATHVKLVIKAAGGAEAYLDNAVTPGGTLTAEQVPNTINNKNVNFSGTYDTGALTADNFLVYNSFSAPGAPTTTIIYPGDTQATVLWDAPADDGSAAISDYVVEYKLSSSLSWSTFNDGTSVSTRATVTGLTNLTAYDFRVFAVNSVGTGYPSDSSSTTPDLAAPNPPTNVVATAGEGQVSLGWTASEDNGSAVTDYIIQYKKGSDSYSTFNDGTSTNTSTIVTGLTNGLQYSFKITATNSFGNSGPSEIVTTTPVLVAATAPTAVNIAVTGFATLYEQLSATYEYIDPNADIEGATTFRWLRANTSGGTYSAIAGETDNTYVLGPDDLGKYIKFEVTAISTTTPVNGTPVLSSATGSIGAEMDYINHLLSTGQSLAVGLNGSPVLSATQPYENLMLDGTSLVPLVETSVETMGSAMGNMITNLVVGNNYQVAVSNHGVSATGYQGLKKGTAPYLNGMDQVTKAKAAAEVLSTPYRVLGVTVVHGEGDSISGGTVSYEGWLQQWQIDYETDVKAISGQVGTIPLYTDQMSSQTGNNMAVSGMPLAQLSAAENNPGKIILVGPKYRYPYVDNVHLTNQGYRMMGEYFGKVIKKVAVDRETWTPLSPSRVERSTNVIYAQFNVPVSPIVFDTTIVSARSNYGFEYSDSTNSASISSVEILNSDTVKVTLSATPTGTSQQLRYAYTGVAGSNPGPQNAGSAAGNLRDSDTTTALSGNVLYNWSVHFAKDITADVTTPVVSSVVQNNNSNSATFAWSTNEVGSTIVEYGVTSSYGYSTTETDQATRVLAHSASLSNLLSCTKYFYQVKSNDFAHNAGSGSGSFTTDGCTASAEIVAQTGSEITTAAGGTLNFDYDSKTFSIVVPVGFSETDATFQIKQFASDAIFAVTSKPTGMLSVGSNVFDLKSFSTATTSVTSFDENISITMEYTDSEISGIDESTLTIYRYDGSNWYALDSCVVDTSANSVTCQTASFSIFGLFGQEAQAATTPTSGGSSMPPEAFLSPIAPAGSFRVSVKENQPIVTSLVTLLFNGGNDVARVAISNSPDFQSASQALYKPEFTWNICNNNTANCTGGMHTIYIKFYTHYGVASEIITSVVDYKPTNNKLTAYFTSCLNKVNSSIMYNSLRNKKADVISLQVFLRENEGFTSLKTNGLYDAQTRKAVIAFQEKYAKDVLVPFGLKKGNGNVLSMTLKKINSLVCPTPTKATIAPTCFKFTKNLSKGSVNAEVKSVKQFLDGYGYAVGIINNIFDGNLFTAVKNFQKDYANEILKPLGIKNPTGMWYTSSIKKANQLLECIK